VAPAGVPSWACRGALLRGTPRCARGASGSAIIAQPVSPVQPFTRSAVHPFTRSPVHHSPFHFSPAPRPPRCPAPAPDLLPAAGSTIGPARRRPEPRRLGGGGEETPAPARRT